jgi:YVTN family beta-propeller protein
VASYVVIEVGQWPNGLALSQNGAYLYVTNAGSNSVSVIETSTRTVKRAPITFGNWPSGVALAVKTNKTRIYVANAESDTVSVIDPTTNAWERTIGVGDRPLGVAASPGGDRIYVANSDSNTVWVIDTTPNSVTARISIPQVWSSPVPVPPASLLDPHPTLVAVTPSGGRGLAYVTNMGSNTVAVIDTTANSVITMIGAYLSPRGWWVQIPGIFSNPTGVAIAPNGKRAYVTNQGSDFVSVINTTTNKVDKTIKGFDHPAGVAVAPDGKHVFVSNVGVFESNPGNTVSVIDTDPSSTSSDEAPRRMPLADTSDALGRPVSSHLLFA